MINFKIGTCPKCGKRNVQLMFSNNPLDGGTICFDCIKENLDYKNLEHADFFCRTYNLSFNLIASSISICNLHKVLTASFCIGLVILLAFKVRL